MDRNYTRVSWIILLILAAFVIVSLLYLFSTLFLILAISILIAFIFEPFVKFFEKEGFNRLSSTFIVFISFSFIIYLAFSFLIPKFITQLNKLIEALQVYSIHDQIIAFENEVHKFLPFFSVGELTAKIEEFISSGIVNSVDQISTLFTSIVSIAAILVIVPFVTFFFLKDSRTIQKGIMHIIPNKYFEMSYWILKKVGYQMGRFVRGWIFDATFVGISCGLGFYFIGIDNALPLGVISGVGHLVPYFGPIIGGIPAILFSIIQYGDLSHVPFIIVLILGIYAMDNGFVQPYVFSKSVDMHPVVIILLILAGSELLGVVGMLLAVPTASVIKTAAQEIYYALKNYKIARL
ncbi:MAG TPA: AI-2E family transporter [Ignavibacteriaceae bacterium]|nr:AI-2E family transporter [Ignavibacteriaceae bacterium]